MRRICRSMEQTITPGRKLFLKIGTATKKLKTQN
jgi:hypothetical protein